MQTSIPDSATHPSSETESLRDLIARQPFLKGLKDDYLRLLTASAMRTQFDAGQLIFQKDDPANRFYLILGGSVVLQTPDTNGAIHILQHLGPGDVLGWSWLYPPYYWHFDAIAEQPTDVIFFYGSRLRLDCEKNHGFGYEMMKRMSEVLINRLQATRRQWIERAK